MSFTLNKTNWRKPAITVPRSQRIQIAQSAIEKAIPNLNGDGLFSTSFYASAVLYSDMAEFDFVSNGTQYKDRLARFLHLRAEETLASNLTRVCLFPLFLFPLPLINNSHAPLQATQDLLELGHAAIRAYAAYKDDAFLGLAINWWQWARAWTVFDSASSSQTAPGHSAPLPSNCSGHSVGGGVFIDTNPTDSNVATLATGNFLILSSLLAEATSNRTYLDQATQTFSFFQNLLLNTTTMIPQESIFLNASDTELCSTNPPTSSYCSGIWIEGLATFSRVADGGSKPNDQLISNSYIGAMSAQNWHTPEGILRMRSENADVNVPRGLGMLYQRTESTQFKSDIEQYLAVQYNAILDLSTINGSNIYAFDWQGPPSSTFDSDGQVTALGVLVPVITLPDTDSTVSNSSSGKKPLLGGIVGGVLGGVFVIAALSVLFLVRRHRKKNLLPPSKEFNDFDQTEGLHIDPFIDSPHSLATKSGFPSSSAPIMQRDEHQLFRDMGEALHILSRRLDRVEGTTPSDPVPPPDYPGSVQNHSSNQIKGSRVVNG